MNPEIYSILEDMKRHIPKNTLADSSKHTYLSIKNSELLVLLAKEAENNSKQLEKLTKILNYFTIAIFALTAFLVTSVFFEFPKKTVNFSHDPSLKTEQTQKVDGSSKIQTLPKSGEAIPNVSK